MNEQRNVDGSVSSDDLDPAPTLGRRARFGERAEGVISTAISVLIIAFLGIALWTGFNSMMNGATEKTRAQVEQIGN